jgi:hypothetical protein
MAGSFRSIYMLSVLMVLFTVSNVARAADEYVERIYPVPEHGILVMRVPAAWQELVAQPRAVVPPTIRFTPADGKGFNYLMTPLWPVPGVARDFGTRDHVKSLVESMIDKIADTAIEKKITLQELSGPNMGFYFTATDKTPDTGEYKYLTQGAVRVGTFVINFTLLSNDKDPAFMQQALTLLRKASQETAPVIDRGLVLTKDNKYQVQATAAPWLVRFDNMGLLVTQERVMDDGKTRFYHFEAADTPLRVSIFIETAKVCKTSNACRALQLSGEDMKSALDVREYDRGEFSILEYRLEELQGKTAKQHRVNAHFVKDGYWLDLQLSQSDDKGFDRELFNKLLQSVEVRRGEAR